ncbi:MAG: two-component regulator propeller domain-containing protein [Bacteroidota bacterium]
MNLSKIMTYAITGMIALSLPFISFAQKPGFIHLTDSEGLLSMTVYDMLQDEEGFLWIGTENGLSKYDGENFTHFNSPSFKDSEVLQLYLSQDSTIWFWNFSGQLFYLDKSESVIEFNPGGYLDTIKVRQFRVDKGGKYWIGASTHGILNFDPSSNSWGTLNPELESHPLIRPYFSKIIEPNYYSPFPLSTSMLEVIDDKIVFGFSLGHLFYYENNRLKEINQNISFLNQFTSKVPLFTKSKSGNLIVNYDLEVLEFNLSDSSLAFNQKSLQIPEGVNINVIEQDHSGNFWVCTRRGVFVFDHKFSPLSLRSGNHLFKEYFINGMFQDREGNRWIYTTGLGIFMLPNLGTTVWNTQNGGLPSDKVKALLKTEDERIFVGTSSNEVMVFTQDLSSKSIVLKDGNEVNTFIEGPDNNILIVSDFGICSSLNPQNQIRANIKFVSPKDDSSFYFSFYTSVIKSSFQKTFNLFDLQKRGAKYKNIHEFHRFVYGEYDRQILLSGTSTTMVDQVDSNQLWLGNNWGLFCFANDSLEKFHSPQFDFKYSVSALAQTADSTIWVGTSSNGLFGIKDNQVQFHITEQNGLPSNAVKALHADDFGQLWAGTNRGITNVGLDGVAKNVIDIYDGLPSNEIYTLLRVSEDLLFAGTNKGLVGLDINNASYANTSTPEVYFTKVSINLNETAIANHYSLPYHKNNISISFQGIGFKRLGNFKYQYRLKNIQEDWIISDQKTVRYPALTPGKYEFEVWALNENGQTGNSPSTISFFIRKPWWGTWIARIGFTVFTLSIVMAIIKNRTDRIRLKEQMIRQHDQLRSQALQAQMNPHFVFNALNSILHFITQGNIKTSAEYLGLFAKVIRDVFEHSKLEEVMLEDEIELLNVYLELEKLRFQDKVNIKVNVDESLLNANILIPPLVVQPTVENAFRHGLMHKKQGGKLEISVAQYNSAIHFIISDNGVGREKAKELNEWRPESYNSSGIKTTEERLRLLWRSSKHDNKIDKPVLIKDLKNEAGEPAGTRVELFIPIIH